MTAVVRTFLRTRQAPLYVIFGILVATFLVGQYDRSSDFSVPVRASALLKEHGNLYTADWAGLHYYYSPLFALLLSFVNWLPGTTVYVLWNAFSLFCLFRVWTLAAESVNADALSISRYRWFVVLSFVFTASFINANFHNVQMSAFLLFCAVQGLANIRNQKVLSGAALLALGINIKILPIVLLPYLLYRGYWRALLWTVVFIGIFLVLPACFIGWTYNAHLLHEWWLLISPADPDQILDLSERGFASVGALIASLCSPFTGTGMPRRHIVSLPIEQITMIINVCRLALVGFWLYFLRSLPFRDRQSSPKRFWELSYLLMITPLIFPHQHSYAFLLAFPAGVYLMHWVVERRDESLSPTLRRVVLVLLTLCFVLNNLELLFGTFRKYYWHYKIITYGILLLIVPLAIGKPRPESPGPLRRL